MTSDLRLLLLSNSRDPQGRYLHHCRDALAAHLRGVRRVAFVPYAGVGVSWDAYAARVAEALAPLGVAVDPVHAHDDPAGCVRDAEAVAVGGGNTFHLLATLQRTGVLEALRARALAGVPYVGWSAGSVVACPTLGTTNDMPIVHPPHGFGALGLVPFQINAHFTDAHPPGFQGETRRERIAEFLVANPEATVIGLPEGDWLDVRGDEVTLRGEHPAFVFRAGEEVQELRQDCRILQD
ncbi:dipeptidase PepE [Roseisolibacter sp. H3M3-2]|uniref:dipeptidase PepE n=1 Tax=Roseisolibacter sp. H3M3-2 TaxID=3031323 RepID=UPI0023DB82B0|nr:dipeptidase PepE [Roseisolibacter sp. H3M3-2]MDF1502683.1 dipeptidase PepE [Roseisolibacter sp. H3M3-2]